MKDAPKSIAYVTYPSKHCSRYLYKKYNITVTEIQTFWLKFIYTTMEEIVITSAGVTFL